MSLDLSPSSSYTPEPINAYTGNRVIGAAICFIFLDITLTTLRYVARRSTKSERGWDDFLILPSLLSNLAMYAVSISQYGGDSFQLSSLISLIRHGALCWSWTPQYRNPYRRRKEICDMGQMHVYIRVAVHHLHCIAKVIGPVHVSSNIPCQNSANCMLLCSRRHLFSHRSFIDQQRLWMPTLRISMGQKYTGGLLLAPIDPLSLDCFFSEYYCWFRNTDSSCSDAVGTPNFKSSENWFDGSVLDGRPVRICVNSSRVYRANDNDWL